ncbi:hypothetical protein [Paenibacillus aceti]|uniref:Uncharacterized protein n=1 Tax=Paenibacillus aceti TaxID=1820010 RepID=A0ABQ1VZJ6_9BACL|nr:hypothetical protein [Paenibacillus aceti]GGG05644.1 hypothetical protein GCM10010913_29280 [Paenibacillus aceti]
MRSSSFLTGVILGATAGVMASKRKINWMAMLSEAGSALSLAGMKTECGHRQARATSSQGSTISAQVFPSNRSAGPSLSSHSKEHSLKQIQDFIKGNPDVRHEVEAILKDNSTQIPGINS